MQKSLTDNRISINEVLTEMRTQGIADITDVKYAILEQNGKLSFLKTGDSPNIATPLVIDGNIDKNNLSSLGLSDEWVKKQLSERNLTIKDVFLMTVNESNTINIIKKENKK